MKNEGRRRVDETLINWPVLEVARYASDPDNATEWYANIKSVQWKTSKPLKVGSRIAFIAKFLGKSLIYTYEVAEFIPNQKFVMSTADGPFPMRPPTPWKRSLQQNKNDFKK